MFPNTLTKAKPLKHGKNTTQNTTIHNMTFLELAQQVLKEAGKPLSSTEIWELAIKKGYDNALNSKGKTPGATLGAQIYVNAKSKPDSVFAKTDTRPKRFYLKAMAHQLDLKVVVDEELVEDKPDLSSKKYLEKDLHKYLSYFARHEFGCYTKTINHTVSNKKEFGGWVHPDMVGCTFYMEDWKPEVFDFSKALGVRGVILYSFEIKRELSFSNLRESFFQCVSNSSWANEAYLVTAKISDNKDFFDELSRLCVSFGIGVIELDLNNIDDSEVIIRSQYKANLDLETINKIAMNNDFKAFLENVKIDLNSKKIHQKEYDLVADIEQLK
jgi:hypothetical protein